MTGTTDLNITNGKTGPEVSQERAIDITTSKTYISSKSISISTPEIKAQNKIIVEKLKKIKAAARL